MASKTREEIRERARLTLEMESNAVRNLSSFLDDSFIDCVELIFKSPGRVVVTGIGKSANIAQKIVATLNSTGTPALFMHAADAIHGDLGNIQKDDVVICLSKSGNTPEVKVLIPLIKNMGNPIAALVGNVDSYLAQQADFILNASVTQEACPNNLAPTTSTTAQLALGDALAVCLLEMRDFSSDDFARYHPGGALGKKLYLRVEDLSEQNAVPKVAPDTTLKDVILEISTKRLGVTAVVENDQVAGIVTDGDLRRMLEKGGELLSLSASDIMTSSPKTIEKGTLAVEALQVMESHNISQLLVTENGKYIGVIHLHDLLREGLI